MNMEKELKYLLWCRAGASIFSTCGKRQYMAIVLGPDGRLVGTGYNGGPSGMAHCADGGCPRFLEGSASGSNYDNCIAIHAEENALLYADRSARARGTIIVNGPPCFGCAKKIANSGLAKLVCLEDESYSDWPRVLAFLVEARVQVRVIPAGVLSKEMAAFHGR